MYGTGQNSPKGLHPSVYADGSIWNGQTSEYLILSGYATSLFTGDPVTLLANGTIGIGVAGSAIVGVFAGCKYLNAQGIATFSPYWPASTITQGAVNAIALIVDDPNVLFDIQVSTSAGSPGPVAAVSLIQSNMFENANFSVLVNSFNAVSGITPLPNPAAGNTATGQSGYYLDYGSLANTATLNLKLIRFTPQPGNVAGVNFNNAIVKINNHIYNGGTGTAGV